MSRAKRATTPLATRFWAKVDKNGPVPAHRPELRNCWIWTAAIRKQDGYGVIGSRTNRAAIAHRLSYEWAKGPIPSGLQIDHLCRVRACVNPEHLEAVTVRENVLRGEGVTAVLSRKTECLKGHPLTPDNLSKWGTGRQCLTCVRERGRAYWRRKAAQS